MINIYITTLNRKDITEFTLNNINQYKKDSKLFLYDDNSTDYDLSFLKQFTTNVISYKEKTGIAKIRKHQIKHFIDSNSDFCYLTDNDTIHDEFFIDKLLEIYEQFNGISSIFNTDFHKTESEYNENLLVKKVITGNSIFFNRKYALNVYNSITNDRLPCDNWDWQISHAFDNFVISKTSYCEHLGWRGIHSSYDNPCRAINPTEFLINEYKRFQELYPEYT